MNVESTFKQDAVFLNNAAQATLSNELTIHKQRSIVKIKLLPFCALVIFTECVYIILDDYHQ